MEEGGNYNGKNKTLKEKEVSAQEEEGGDYKEINKTMKNTHAKVFFFINEDVTNMRARILRMVQERGKLNAWLVNGRIHCLKKQAPGTEMAHREPHDTQGSSDDRDKPIIVEYTDNFCKLCEEVDHVNFAELG